MLNRFCGQTAIRSLVTAAVIASVLGATTTPARAGGDRLMLVSWDGVARRVLNELRYWQPANEAPKNCPSQRFDPVPPELCGNYWTCVPTLCRFNIIESWDSAGKPMTRPQHAQMLSGYSPNTTGVYRNSSAASMPPGYTVYERLKKGVGPQLKTVHIAGRKYVSMGVVANASRAGALDVNMSRGGPDNRTGFNTTERVIPLIQQYATGPLFMFVHYKEADVNGHMWGSESAAYREGIGIVDRELGKLLDAMQAAGSLATTPVLLTTDHGFTGRFHISRDVTNTDTWIASLNISLRSDIPPKLLDVTPTILDYFGVTAAKSTPTLPPLEGESLLAHSSTTTVTVVPSSTTVQDTSTTSPAAVTTTIAASPATVP